MTEQNQKRIGTITGADSGRMLWLAEAKTIKSALKMVADYFCLPKDEISVECYARGARQFYYRGQLLGARLSMKYNKGITWVKPREDYLKILEARCLADKPRADALRLGI
jgi:hypothetical protein